MAELRNFLNNGRFLTDLSSWTAVSASYLSSDGDEHYGMADISVGGSISQQFSVPHARGYSLHISVKPASALSAGNATAVLTQDGNAVVTTSLTGSSGAWNEQTLAVGLVPGATYTLTINAVSVAIKVDDVWLWFVPISRTTIAAQVHARLGTLATDASLSTTPAGALTEGSYTYAIDAGLRQVGAVDPETALPDIRFLGTGTVDDLLVAVEREMLQRLHRYYATRVDISVGQRSESLSQVSKAIAALLDSNSATNSRQAKTAKARRDDVWDYPTYNDGSVDARPVIRVGEDSGI